MRTVAALYDSRAEAERARSRLLSEAKARSPRILAKDTLGALEGLKIPPADVQAYRESLRRGCYLVVAQVPRGCDSRRVIEVLEQSISTDSDEPVEGSWGDGEQGVHVKLPGEAEPPVAQQPVPQTQADPAREADRERLPQTEASPSSAPQEEERIPIVQEELRIGKRRIVGGGARLRALTREAPAEEQVSLTDEFVEVESRPSQRELTESEVEASGLFTDRVFEVAEMREEPMVTKTAVVREEVIIRKRVSEHVEMIRDTVRHTEVEVEDLAAPV